jgi:putative dimethyl sulfoxide reductase chaperone
MDAVQAGADEEELRRALADDLDGLIRLHDRELDGEALAALQATAFPAGLALLPVGEAAELAYRGMAAALAELPPGAAGAPVDALAADFAAIYLTGAAGASPYESVWVTEEHLACQQPMFELREIYAAAGLQVDDWRKRYDDHLVLQLQYLVRQLRAGASWASLAGFLDEHLGYWFPDFARRVSERASTPFYGALAELSYVWLERFRDLLADMADLPRPARETITARIRAKLGYEASQLAPVKFMPGVGGPSW